MSGNLLDWLLREDMLNLREGLKSAFDDTSDTTLLEEAMAESDFDADEEDLSIAAATAGGSKRPLLIGGIAALIVVGLGAALFLVPPAALGPLGGLAAGLQGSEQTAPAPPTKGAPPTAQPAASAAPAAITTVAQAATAPTTTTTAPRGVATGTPGAVYVISGPLPDAAIPDILLPAPYNGRITTVSVTLSGIKLNSAQPAAAEDAAGATAEFEMQAIPYTVEEVDQGQLLQVGPLQTAEDVERATAVLVSNGIAPRQEESTWDADHHFLNLGPFPDGPDSQEAQKTADKMLQLKSWLKPATD